MPIISEHLLSQERLLRRRAAAEQTRRRRGERHQLHYFHQTDDPYSALLAAALPQLMARYDVELLAHVVGPPPDAAAPDRAKLVAWSRKDAQLLAGRFGVDFSDAGNQPPAPAVAATTALLVSATRTGRFAENAGRLSQNLWQHAAAPGRSPAPPDAALLPADPGTVATHLAESDALRQRLGHYLGATLCYAGEWYWGLDRLHHLEQRLQDLGAQRPGTGGSMFPPDMDLQYTGPIANAPPIDFFFSLRSPYSALAAPRIFQLGRASGAPVRLRYLLPMVMRGLPVPRNKRMYISLDAAREARQHGIAFGRVNDPLGRPTERGLALMPYAEGAGLGQAYVLSFMRGVWAEGLDAGSDRGLRTIAERSGLDWAKAQEALRDEGWRATAESNRAELDALGLWGVPSFRVGDTVVWGQDRLWAVQQALNGQAAAAREPTQAAHERA